MQQLTADNKSHRGPGTGDRRRPEITEAGTASQCTAKSWLGFPSRSWRFRRKLLECADRANQRRAPSTKYKRQVKTEKYDLYLPVPLRRAQLRPYYCLLRGKKKTTTAECLQKVIQRKSSKTCTSNIFLLLCFFFSC